MKKKKKTYFDTPWDFVYQSSIPPTPAFGGANRSFFVIRAGGGKQKRQTNVINGWHVVQLCNNT